MYSSHPLELQPGESLCNGPINLWAETVLQSTWVLARASNKNLLYVLRIENNCCFFSDTRNEGVGLPDPRPDLAHKNVLAFLKHIQSSLTVYSTMVTHQNVTAVSNRASISTQLSEFVSLL